MTTIQHITLFDSMYTKQEIAQFLMKLEELKKIYFTTNPDVHHALDQLCSHDEKETILSFFQANQLNIQSRADFENVLRYVKEQASQLPIVTIQVAFQPSEEGLKNLSKLIQIYSNRKMLIEIVVKREILGGAILIYNGLYKDYSLRKRLLAELEKKTAQM